MQKSKNKEQKQHKSYAQHKHDLVGQGNKLVSTPSHSIHSINKYDNIKHK